MTIETLPDQRLYPFRLARSGGKMLLALINGYAVILILVMLARLLVGERWLVIAIFNTYLHLLWLFALVLLPLCLLLRQPRTALLLLPSVLAFMFTYGGQFIPRSPAAPDNAAEIRLLTYNILAYDDDMLDRVALIREADADIVALQEFSQLMNDTVIAELADMYPYMALHAVEKPSAGQAVLSRYPIVEDTFWQYEWLPKKLGHQRVVLDVNGIPVVLYNIHYTHPGMAGDAVFNHEFRHREVLDMLSRLESETGRLLMMGDFNMTDLSDDYARIAARYHDAYRTVGWGLGWSFLEPIQFRMDYIFYNDGGFQPLEARVWQSPGGSDHHPVLVRMGITS